MRLPGSVAEVQASPPGPEIGAFFDLDGTLVAGFTGVLLTQDTFRRREIGIGEFLGVVQSALNHQLGRADFEDLVHKGASMLRGRSLSDLDQIGERLFVQKVVSRIYPEMRELVRAHMERGHTVVPSSSALTIQVQPVARFLGIKNILSNRFETDDDGLLTGKVLKPILWGPRKGKRRPKIRVRTRNRPFQELVLRRRRRRRRADVPRRQSATHQPGGRNGGGRGQTRLAGAAVHQPQRCQPALAVAHPRPARRWAVALDAGGLVFVDSDQLVAE